jgi:hypothetical protein
VCASRLIKGQATSRRNSCHVQRKEQASGYLALPVPYGPSEPHPDLALVMSAWPDLPEAIRAGIMAMVRASAGMEKNVGTT